MLLTKRKPVSVGEMLIGEFLEPLGLSQTELAGRSGLPRKHVNKGIWQLRRFLAEHAAPHRSMGGVEHTQASKPDCAGYTA
jgi:plasmid maintenance system antidote protein VapI